MPIDPLYKVSDEIRRMYEETLALVGRELTDKMYPGVGKKLDKERAAEGLPPYATLREPVGVRLPLISRGQR